VLGILVPHRASGSSEDRRRTLAFSDLQEWAILGLQLRYGVELKQHTAFSHPIVVLDQQPCYLANDPRRHEGLHDRSHRRHPSRLC